MPFELDHIVVSRPFTPTAHTTGGESFCTVSVDGDLQVLYPGRLQVATSATFTHRAHVGADSGPGGEAPEHGGFNTESHRIPVRTTLFTPDGREFTRDVITVADLREFRDLRCRAEGPGLVWGKCWSG